MMLEKRLVPLLCELVAHNTQCESLSLGVARSFTPSSWRLYQLRPLHEQDSYPLPVSL